MKSVESQGKTVELAIENGLAELNVTLDKVSIEIISQGGLFKKPCVRLTLRQTQGGIALSFVEGLLDKLGMTAFAELTEGEEASEINMVGADIGMLIGHRGEVLEAIQTCASAVANKESEAFRRIIVDGDGYRAKRIQGIEDMAVRLADKAIKSRRQIRTQPMSSFERRVIHSKLQSLEVTTHSEGDEPNRFLVITPKGTYKKADDRKQGGDRRQGGYGKGSREGYGGNNRGGYNRNQGGDRGNNTSQGTAAQGKTERVNQAPPQNPRSYAFRSSNKRPSPYSRTGKQSGFSEGGIKPSGFSDPGIKQSGFSDPGIKQSGFSDAALINKSNFE